MIEVGSKVRVRVAALAGEPFKSVNVSTKVVDATVIFVNRAHDFYVAEWITAGGWKRRETFYTGSRVGRRDS